MSRVLNFLRRNVVFVVCIPSIAAIHYGWYNLQFDEDFVPESERRVNPFDSLTSWWKQLGRKRAD